MRKKLNGLDQGEISFILPCHSFFCNWFRSEKAFFLIVCANVAMIIDLGLIPDISNGYIGNEIFQ